MAVILLLVSVAPLNFLEFHFAINTSILDINKTKIITTSEEQTAQKIRRNIFCRPFFLKFVVDNSSTTEMRRAILSGRKINGRLSEITVSRTKMLTFKLICDFLNV